MTREKLVHGIEDFATLISCLDYRIDDFGIPRPNKHTYVDRLRSRIEKGGYAVMHLSFLKPLGIGTLAAIIEDQELAQRLRKEPAVDNSLLARLGIPLPHFVWNMILLKNNKMIITWYNFPDIDADLVAAWVDTRGEWLGPGWKVPVHTCLPRPTPEDIPTLASRLNDLLLVGKPRIRTPILAYILIALLDKFPLAPLREIVSLSMIAAARDLEEWMKREGIKEKLRLRFIYRYYKTLSRHYVVGRYRLFYPAQLTRGIPLFVMAPSKAANRLYGVMALYRGGAHIFMNRGLTFTAMRVAPEDAAQIISLIRDTGAEAQAYERVFLFPLPFEYYDPIENRWEEKPVEKIPEALRKLRYLLRG